MNEMLILENLNDCKTRNDVENLWTATYLQYRDEAWKVWQKFEDQRGKVLPSPNNFSPTYTGSWD